LIDLENKTFEINGKKLSNFGIPEPQRENNN
jgi:hypothetical protein